MGVTSRVWYRVKPCSTGLGYLWLEAARSGPQQAEGEPSDEEEVNSAPHDRFPKLESVPCVCFHHTAEGENERPEWSVGRWVSASFLPCHSVEVFSTSLAVLSVAESSSAVTSGSVVVWESCDAKETMAMLIFSLERPLAADPMILMSSPRCVPMTRGST
jgi:hypothetical protein